jgi:nicotinamide-nucleotide amidase
MRAGPGAVALVLVGDELLAGHVTDTNGPWLGRRLAEAGLEVVSSAYAPDEPDAVVKAVERALDDAPAVVVTGGLGTTSDDVTRLALARVSNGLSVRALPNGRGIEQGVRLDLGQGTVYAVPGVPAEMAAMVEKHVLPALLARAGALPPRTTRSLLVVGPGERQIADLLSPLEVTGRLSYLPRAGEVEVRIRVEGADAFARADAAIRAARELLGDTVAAEGGSLAETVVGLLIKANATLATAESLTGGLLAGALVSVPGVSAVFRGGVVAYATDLKADLASVPASVLERDGPVATSTAVAMAEGVRRRCGATFGAATTGVAGPDAQDDHAPGTFHVAVAWEGGVRHLSRVPPAGVTSSRDTIRRMAVTWSLDLLRRAVGGLGPGPGESRPGPTR